MLLTQNLSLLRRMGEVPGTVLGAGRAKDMKTVGGGGAEELKVNVLAMW